MSDTPAPAPTVAPAPTIIEEPVPITDDGDHDLFAHIINKADQMKGYVMGEAVRALCGKVWVPTRDPERFPLCPTCKEILAQIHAERP
ncbi:MAG: DUF3039 domain-containing protein [Actinobacteria bacterium]|nr:DUF3039 domain-containing protein [Actinomycetota bacterium]